MVSLTGAGWAALQAAAPPHVESVRRHLIDLLTTAEVQALADITAKVIAHIGHLGQPDWVKGSGPQAHAW